MRFSQWLQAAALASATIALTALVATSCATGSDDDDPYPGSPSKGGNAGTAGSDGGDDTDGNNGVGGNGNNSGTGGKDGGNKDGEEDDEGGIPGEEPEDPNCAGTNYPSERPPLDVYILLDATGSMNGDKESNPPKPDVWTPVKAALNQVFSNKLTADMSIGLTYYPVQPAPGTVIHGACPPACGAGMGTCKATVPGGAIIPGIGKACSNSCSKHSDCGLYGDCVPFPTAPFGADRMCQGALTPKVSCDPADYGQPIVPLAVMPGNQTALSNALSKKSADGDATPTLAALRGTVNYLKTYSKTNANHLISIVLATDGEPNDCTGGTGKDAITNIADLAKKAYTEYPMMPVFVLGIGDLKKLDPIAKAGGTEKTYIADGKTVADELVAVFNEIRANGVCKFVIPDPPDSEDGKVLDFNKVNVWYTPLAATEPVQVQYVGEESKCDPVTGGWYYNDPTKKNPSMIFLCPATCEGIRLSGSGLDVELGCKTRNQIY